MTKSNIDIHNIATAAGGRFGVSGHYERLVGEHDLNIKVAAPDREPVVLKISSAEEDAAAIELQCKILDHLESPGVPAPRLLPSKAGNKAEGFEFDGQSYQARCLTFLPGRPLAKVNPHSQELLRAIGAALADVDAALQTFEHPAAERDLIWDLQNATDVVRERLQFLDNAEDRALVEQFMKLFANRLAERQSDLPRQVIQNDANDHNILVDGDGMTSDYRVALIDFGDAVRTCRIFELAIATAYIALDKQHPLHAVTELVAAYHRALPLTEAELEMVFPALCARLCVSVSISASRKTEVAANPYLAISEESAWATLRTLQDIDANFPTYLFRNACGREACPQTATITNWLRRAKPALVVPVDLTSEPVRIFDLSVTSSEFTGMESADTAAWSGRLFEAIRSAGASAGIGRYDEPRLVYAAEQFATGGAVAQHRTVHIGIDIFMPPGTPISAPFAGKIHSLQNNALSLDYGPTVILKHSAGEDGPSFYTLYGHLSSDSLDGKESGQHIEAGETFAAIGDFPENGDWPPHLHFQIMVDMLGMSGDFPGVADPDERDIWLSLCPDPNLILRIPQTLFPDKPLSTEAIHEVRERLLSPSLSLSYRKPLHIVRGRGQYLYDALGRRYLDCVNNVAHVGHCHQRVVEAIARQSAVLNTNTRYLHPLLMRYAEALVEKFPEPLQVCFFVNSGSEANELALRLARTYTGGSDFIVIDGAYHGNTGGLIDVSPYKHDGPGGAGAPAHVHKVSMPDAFRDDFCNVEVGRSPARDVSNAIAALQSDGRGLAGFICESLLSCGGQIVLPDKYLAEAYRAVRAATGVCIADEVQVGFGRVGERFWGFETQGVVPDIVTLGKPIGNGHPLGAVVTTRAIAEAFANGMEYFNTFGGNPVSCAAGLAVLDVIESEGLQAHAAEVGDYLLRGLRELQRSYPIIGDVRGLGFFLGVELILDRETLAPGAPQAKYIIERMKDEGILLSIDGPLKNVLKFKPPMVFSRENAEQFSKALRKILGEDFLQLPK